MATAKKPAAKKPVAKKATTKKPTARAIAQKPAIRRPDPNLPPNKQLIDNITDDILYLITVIDSYAANLRALVLSGCAGQLRSFAKQNSTNSPWSLRFSANS